LVGLKKARRGTSDAVFQAAQKISTDGNVHLKLKGFGIGRNHVLRAYSFLKIVKISDVTGIRHGGNRPPKQRRL
jgi:ribosomal protein S11